MTELEEKRLQEAEQRKWQEKEVIRQEQFWFTATTATLIGVLGSVLKNPTGVTGGIALFMIVVLALLTIYLLVHRFKVYWEKDPDKPKFKNWGAACWGAITERSGTLYCVLIVFVAAVGFGSIVLCSINNNTSQVSVEIRPGTRITIVP